MFCEEGLELGGKGFTAEVLGDDLSGGGIDEVVPGDAVHAVAGPDRTGAGAAAPQGGSAALYDIVYIDANKREYCMYYDLVFDLVRPGGLILADNVLWDGKVFQEPLPRDRQTAGIASFNDMVASDPRVESVILPLRDGLNVIRKR